MALSISRADVAGTVTVTVAGEVDLLTNGELEREIIDRTEAATLVVVDLTAVTFLDSVGISTLLKGRRAAQGRGQQYRVVGPQGHIREILELTGVWAHLSGGDQ